MDGRLLLPRGTVLHNKEVQGCASTLTDAHPAECQPTGIGSEKQECAGVTTRPHHVPCRRRATQLEYERAVFMAGVRFTGGSELKACVRGLRRRVIDQALISESEGHLLEMLCWAYSRELPADVVPEWAR